ncbi:MAG: proton-conducting transporter membrane subunit [Desulfobaccales bacterium]
MFNLNILFFLFLILCAAGVVLAATLPARRNPVALAWIGSLASLSLLLLSGHILLSGHPFQIKLWQVFSLGQMLFRIDRLSALFIFSAAMVFFPVSIFTAPYMNLKKYRGRYSLKSFGIYYHLLFASLVLLLAAGDVISFLLTWEAMSIFTYLLVNYEHEKEETTRSGYLMLSLGEAGTLAALLAFLLLGRGAATLDFASLRAAAAGISEPLAWAIFLLSFFGFGVKAGLVPTNIWLPRAHPAAPSNISAILSGVILNLGLYGIVRLNGDLLPITSVGPGVLVLIVGTVTALVGILYATIRNDLKEMLAHSSIENMGIITAGLGAGFIFRASGMPVLAGIAFIAAFYHLLNHALYKALLFLGAGAVDYGAGERHMDRLGGLIRVMPWTSFFFLAGALSIAALPPFNGFVSEWLTLQTMLQSVALKSVAVKMVFALCAAALALTAALAVTCFVKAFAMCFLGVARSAKASQAVEAPRSMQTPLAILAVCCLLFGILPTYVIPVLDKTIATFSRVQMAAELVPPFFTAPKGNAQFGEAFMAEFHDLGAQVGRSLLPGQGLVILHRGTERNPVVFAMSTSYTFVVLILLLAGSFLVIRLLTRGRTVIRGPAWEGGVRRLFPEMTYSATGFSNPVRVIFQAIFRPSSFSERKEAVAGHFLIALKSRRQDVHILERAIFNPVARLAQRLAALLARIHSGSVNLYAAYILITLLIVLLIQRLT